MNEYETKETIKQLAIEIIYQYPGADVKTLMSKAMKLCRRSINPSWVQEAIITELNNIQERPNNE